MGVPHRATVLILRAIPTMVLAIFNAPVVPGQLPQRWGPGLLRPKSVDRESGFMGFLGDLALAHVLDVAVEANDLGDPGQADGGGVGGDAPEFAPLNSPVAFIQRAGLRGEGRRAAVARLWPAPWAGWL